MVAWHTSLFVSSSTALWHSSGCYIRKYIQVNETLLCCPGEYHPISDTDSTCRWHTSIDANLHEKQLLDQYDKQLLSLFDIGAKVGDISP